MRLTEGFSQELRDAIDSTQDEYTSPRTPKIRKIHLGQTPIDRRSQTAAAGKASNVDLTAFSSSIASFSGKFSEKTPVLQSVDVYM
jgi:hypothetical protein